MTTGTVTLHRVLRCTPERLYRAFTTPLALAKWLPPGGFCGQVHDFDLRVGGAYRMSFTQLDTGFTHSWGGRYLDLQPNRRLVYTATFDDPQLPGEMQTTVEMRAVACGTELHAVQTGIPAAIPTEMCVLGWQESLLNLALLVEGPPAP